MQRVRVQIALVFFSALLPRVIGLRDFLTTDEAYHWISRTERFVAAIGAGHWADTILTGHPGVTLMWLGGLGLQLERVAVALGLAVPPDQLGHLAWLRLGPVLAHALLITGGYLLLRYLVRSHTAFIAALLWATSPFLVAQGRLLHLDALLADLCTLTVLAAMIACRAARPLPWITLSGLLCGLTLLTKGPALIVLPFVGIFFFVVETPRRGIATALAWAIPRYLLWLAVALAVVFVLWPALWVTPELALSSYVGEIVGNGGRANGDGQFFLGQSNADPGALFYPLAGLFRLTPLETLGLVLLPLALWRRGDDDDRATILTLGTFALCWVLVMTFGPKKFDRYILPTWPALMALAAYGLVALFECVMQNAKCKMQDARCTMHDAQCTMHNARCTMHDAQCTIHNAQIGSRFSIVHCALCIGIFQGLTLAWYHPYYLSYYNPLLGGGEVAQNIFLIGWGEGMDLAGGWLSRQADSGAGQVLSALPPTLQPFVPVPVQQVDALDRVPANYAVVYRESLQRQADPARYARIQSAAPLHVVTIHGIDYAWIYQLSRPFATARPARFGAGLRLRGYTLAREPGHLIVTPSWDVAGPVGGDTMLFLHIYSPTGKRVASVDVPPGGAAFPPTGQWQAGQQIAVPLPISLPADLPTDTYTITLGLYDPTSGARLPLAEGPAADPALAGGDALLLGAVSLDSAP